jgi:hypothetical protein
MQINTNNPFASLVQDWSAFRHDAASASSARAATTVEDAMIDGRVSTPSPATLKFQEQFGALARDEAKFHAFMKKVYGENYDPAAAEQLRQQALKGDYSFLPPVQFVSRESLGGANGAYSAEDGVVYLAEDLKGNPELMQATFVEEAGHHIDTLVNQSDARGDEGELFRRLLSGEKLSDGQVADIRGEDDHGTIVVNGKKVDVEFWNPFKAVKDFVSDVGGKIKDAATAVWDGLDKIGVADTIRSMGSFFKDVGIGFKDFFTTNPLDHFKKLGAGLKGMAGKMWDGIKFLGEKTGSFFKHVGLGFKEFFTTNPLDHLKKLGEGLLGLGSKAWDGIKFLGEKIGAGSAWLAGKAVDGIVWAVKGAWNNSFGPAIKAVRETF